MSNTSLAHLIARITLGINFFLHGLVRIPKLSQFASGLAKGFEGTLIPPSLAEYFALGIPFIEVGLGILIGVGIASKKSLAAAGVFIMILISGSALKEDWNAVGTQMVYALFIFFLIRELQHEVWALYKPGHGKQALEKNPSKL